ncbi:MAG: TonB family protein [Spirochaetes bacterium]|nr:TonB family protein [Spirochaetota bacterium]
MEKRGKIIFLLALVISVMLHFIILSISPEVEYENKTNNGDTGLHIINAVVIKKPVIKESYRKKLSAVKTRIREKKIKETSAAVENVKSIKKKDIPVHNMPESLIENKLKRFITPPGQRSQTGIPDSGTPKKKIFIPFYKVDKRPEFLYKAKLQYPLRAKQLGVEGTVILEADIDGKGKIVNVRIVKKAGFGFDEAAVDMIKMSEFTPAYSNGKPVPVRMRFTILFKLE